MAERPDKPIHTFEAGTLHISDPEGQIAVHAWPDPFARKRLWHNKWKPYVPEFRLVKPYRRSKRKTAALNDPNQLMLGIDCPQSPRTVTALDGKRKAFDSLRFSLPKELAKGVESFRNHQWWMIVMASILESPALDLLKSNPILAYMLANNLSFQRMLLDDERRGRALKLVCLKQRELLRKFKYPDSQRMVSIIRKMKPQSIDLEALLELRRAIGDESVEKHLLHLPTINCGTLSLVTNPELATTYTTKLLREISESRREDYYPFTAQMIDEISYMFRLARPGTSVPVFRSLAKVQQCHDEISVDFLRVSSTKLKYCKIPRPPLPGTDSIIPLSSISQLKKEGSDQRNCVGSYARRVSKRKTYIYKVLAPERATLAIVKTSGGTWRIGELRCAGNTDVKAQTRKAVQACLASHSMAV